MGYSALLLIHQLAVALSFLGFFGRGLGMIGDARWIQSRPARTLPHVVDTILLASALGLVYLLGYIVSVAITNSAGGFLAGFR